MKVLFVSSGNADSGISPIIRNQGESIIKQGLGLDFFAIEGKGAWSYFRHIFILKKYLRNHDYNIVHAHFSLSGLVSTFAGATPLVISLMGDDVKSNSIFTYIVKIFTRIFWKTIILKSLDMKETLGLKKTIVIPNGVNLEKFKPINYQEAIKITKWNQSKMHILFASDPNRSEKNYKLAIDAFNMINSNEIELHVLESIPNEKMPDYINASDVVLLTSFWEGSPNVIKESMACNRPIVSTNVGDVSWVIGNTAGCYICGFDPVDVKEKIQQALNFPKTKGQPNGRDRIIELGLDSDTIAKKIISVYSSIIK